MFAHFVYGLTVTDKGSILAFAEARIDKSSDDGAHHLVLKRSTDKGRSFSPSAIVVESKEGQSWTNPTVVQDRETNEIFLFYALNHNNVSTQVFFKSSTDDGLSWSDAREITSLFVENAHGWTFHLPGPGHGIQLQGEGFWFRSGTGSPFLLLLHKEIMGLIACIAMTMEKHGNWEVIPRWEN